MTYDEAVSAFNFDQPCLWDGGKVLLCSISEREAMVEDTLGQYIVPLSELTVARRTLTKATA